jgi:uncharacterized protein (DUF2141 family)
MKQFTTILLALAVCMLFVSAAVAKDIGNRDVLRLADVRAENGEFKVAVQVVNDQDIAAMDIPIRFASIGDPITLDRVEWSERVADWDFTHAAIDNTNKTVILGLISELVNIRPEADLKVAANGQTKIADLVFRVDGAFEASFETFTTEHPGHELTFIYNRYEAGKPYVESYAPEFEANVSFKAENLPTEFALSQNYPNPFNPSTSFVLSLPKASDYAVRIFNVTGQLVKTYSGHAEAGKVTITWDGVNEQGSNVASGVYFYRAEAQNFADTRKMMFLK